MRRIQAASLFAAAALAAGSLPARAVTADEVIAKHVEAHGGVERWKAIRSLKITGSQTAFSRTAPFAVLRTSEGKYHLDSVMDGKKVEVGYDGETAWWDNHWFQQGARKIRGADLPVVVRDADFATPFFDYRAKGYEVSLTGKSEFEGVETIALEVKRPDGLSETWHLDPKTYLEVARLSPGSDFGQPMPLRTYYDDFRAVDGVKVPFRVESQWYTRERIWNVDKVETNITVDEAIFRMPPPEGMGPLLPLVGDWKVAVSRRQAPQAPWSESERTSKIEKLLGGALLQERFLSGEGDEVIRSVTYDRFRKLYRITEVNEGTTYLDILDGPMDEAKRLSATNVASGTTFEGFGRVFHARLSIFEIGPDGFKMEEEISTDGGKNWFLAGKSAYTRAAP